MSLRKRETRQLHLSRIRKVHAGWLVVFAAVVLTVLGVEAISTTQPNTAIRQMLLGVVGFVSAFGIAFVPAKRLRQASWWLYVGGLLLLLFLLIPGVPDFIVHPRNGARRWINVGVTDFQPSELLKIAFVLANSFMILSKEVFKPSSSFAVLFSVISSLSK